MVIKTILRMIYLLSYLLKIFMIILEEFKGRKLPLTTKFNSFSENEIKWG